MCLIKALLFIYVLFTQNVQMAFGAGPLIQTITRSSTTQSWLTVEQTAVYLSRVCQWKEAVRRPPPQRCPSVR